MYIVEGKTLVKVEISGQDALSIAFEVWKESVGRKGWSCLGNRWGIVPKDKSSLAKFENCTKEEKEVDSLFNNLFEFLNNSKGE